MFVHIEERSKQGFVLQLIHLLACQGLFFFLLKILKVLQRAILVEGFMMFQEMWDALKKELEGDVLLGSIIWAGCNILENLFLANNGEEKILTSIR